MPDTLFTQVQFTLQGLMNQVQMGQIGLPDIQRPFVWKNTKVRDLFDSMYRGYPVGYLLFWQNGFAGEHRQIGTDDKQLVAQQLVVDGQQRLTNCITVMADGSQRGVRLQPCGEGGNHTIQSEARWRKLPSRVRSSRLRDLTCRSIKSWRSW